MNTHTQKGKANVKKASTIGLPILGKEYMSIPIFL